MAIEVIGLHGRKNQSGTNLIATNLTKKYTLVSNYTIIELNKLQGNSLKGGKMP